MDAVENMYRLLEMTGRGRRPKNLSEDAQEEVSECKVKDHFEPPRCHHTVLFCSYKEEIHIQDPPCLSLQEENPTDSQWTPSSPSGQGQGPIDSYQR